MAEETEEEAKRADAVAAQRQSDAVLWCIVMLLVIVASALIGKVRSNHAGL